MDVSPLPLHNHYSTSQSIAISHLRNTKRRIVKLFVSGESVADIAKEYEVGRSTVYKILNETKEID